jgi:GT2 family glycosyltransferase
MEKAATVSPRGGPRSVSVIVPVKNGGRLLGALLQSLDVQVTQVPFEIIVVDDGSTDDTAEVARQFRCVQPISVVAGPRRGIGPARNAGASVAGGDLLAFIDHDDEAEAGWIEAFVRAAYGWPALGGHMDEEALNDPRSRFRRPSTPGRLPLVLPGIPYALGGNLAVSADLYADVGGFPDAWQGTSEDCMFGALLGLAGFPTRYVPEARVRYRHRNGLRDTWRQHYAYGHSHPMLVRELRAVGGRPRHAWRNVAYNVGGTVVLAPLAAVSRKWRGRWVACSATTAGRVVGSIDHKNLWLG